ncbi:MAG: cupin domain-containing protein [Candidatus Diapherotrites archaeon]
MIKGWKNIRDLIEYPREGILSKELIKGKKIDLTLFCMAKGSRISEHTSAREGFVFVLEGKGSFKLKAKNISMLPGVLIFLPKNAAHALKARENTSFFLSLYGEK